MFLLIIVRIKLKMKLKFSAPVVALSVDEELGVPQLTL